MAELCYHASHEQFTPSRLLKLVVAAEEAGFEAIHSSDHFHPWSVSQGQSGFSFAWLGAAMQATSLPFSVVCAPGQRYHPAIVAQAVATLAEMFPGRFNVELGSGEALNEMITGEPWPEKSLRNARLLECANIIRRLLAGEEVTHEGLVKVREAKLYTRPAQQPLIFAAAISEETTEWASSWADGLLTTADDEETTQRKMKKFNKPGAPVRPFIVQYSFSYGENEHEAVAAAHHQWRSNMVGTEALADYNKPEHFDEAGRNVTREEIAAAIPIVTDIRQLFRNIEMYEQMGVDRISLHNIARNHEKFIADFKAFKHKR